MNMMEMNMWQKNIEPGTNIFCKCKECSKDFLFNESDADDNTVFCCLKHEDAYIKDLNNYIKDQYNICK